MESLAGMSSAAPSERPDARTINMKRTDNYRTMTSLDARHSEARPAARRSRQAILQTRQWQRLFHRLLLGPNAAAVKRLRPHHHGLVAISATVQFQDDVMLRIVHARYQALAELADVLR